MSIGRMPGRILLCSRIYGIRNGKLSLVFSGDGSSC